MFLLMPVVNRSFSAKVMNSDKLMSILGNSKLDGIYITLIYFPNFHLVTVFEVVLLRYDI